MQQVDETQDGDISDLAVRTNMEDLARYALICQASCLAFSSFLTCPQSEGLMPIVEPDISLQVLSCLRSEGGGGAEQESKQGDYDLETAIRVNVKVQSHLYKVHLPLHPSSLLLTHCRRCWTMGCTWRAQR